MLTLPFVPLQDGYGVDLKDGLLSVELDGGAPWTRLDIVGGVRQVQVSWVLGADEYSVMMGFHRAFVRTGGELFYADLVIDSGAIERYQAKFVSGSFRLISKQGPTYTVSAVLNVYPLRGYLDAVLDPMTTMLELLPYYGSIAAVREMFNGLEKLVNKDWPNA